MKPRFRFKGGVWSCASWRVEERPDAKLRLLLWRVGYGDTVLEAWNDWKEQP